MANAYNNLPKQSVNIPSSKAPQGKNIPQIEYHNVPAARAKNTGLRTPNPTPGKGKK